MAENRDQRTEPVIGSAGRVTGGNLCRAARPTRWRVQCVSPPGITNRDQQNMDVQSAPKKFYKKWWFWLIIVLVLGGLASTPNSPSTTATTATASDTQSAPTPKEARTLGQDAYLRLPNNSDPKQVLCLAPTKDVYDEYTKALMAQDYQGILDLSAQGLFCVHNGSEVKVIDTSVVLTRVRVVKGASDVDSDKVGQAGWSASEWVVDR